MSADPTRCQVCGERPNHPNHAYDAGGHRFKRLLVHQPPPPKGRWVKAVILLLVATAIFAVAWLAR